MSDGESHINNDSWHRTRRRKRRSNETQRSGWEEGNPEKRLVAHNAQSIIPYPRLACLPAVAADGPPAPPRIDLFPLLRRPVLAGRRYGWGFIPSFEDGWVH